MPTDESFLREIDLEEFCNEVVADPDIQKAKIFQEQVLEAGQIKNEVKHAYAKDTSHQSKNKVLYHPAHVHESGTLLPIGWTPCRGCPDSTGSI